ncbi:MAG: DUF4065 domain-containing protein [Bacteroidaceae bacterium]|nr:DUF4065 domain-containing protein [Bacteroidaceae bacterium]
MKLVSIKDFAKFMGLSMLQRNISVSPLKLQKLLYYQQAWHMVFFGRENTLFADVPEAWVNGPVYTSIYPVYKDKVDGMCDHMKPEHFLQEGEDMNSAIESLAKEMDLEDEEMNLANEIIMLYGTKSQNYLIFLTHSEDPWAEKRIGLQPYEASSTPISLDTMYRYYKERHDKYGNKQ